MPAGRAGLASVIARDNEPEGLEVPPPSQAERKIPQTRTAKRKHFFIIHLLLSEESVYN
jgi:hypothetical protein